MFPDILYSSTLRFGVSTQAYVGICPGFLKFLSEDIIFDLNHKLDCSKHKSCSFFCIWFLFVIEVWPQKLRARSSRQRCNGVFWYASNPSRILSVTKHNTTLDPKDMAIRGLETIAIQDLGMGIRVGDRADFRSCHENPLPILVLRVESQPQLPTVSLQREASTDLTQLLPSPYCSHCSVNYPFLSPTAFQRFWNCVS